MSTPRRILLTRLRFLGDVVLTTPMIDALRERFPEASLEYLVEAPFGEILLDHPKLDVVHVLPKGASPTDMFRFAERLRSPRIDWWFDLLTNPRSCLLALLARPRVGVGSDRGLRARVYAHRRRRPQGDPSAIAHHLDKLVPLLGATSPTRTSLFVSERRRADSARRWDIEAMGAPVLLHPGSTWPDKAWPEERWGQLVSTIAKEAPGPLWMLTPPGEEHMARRVAETAGVRRLPVLDLSDLLPLLTHARMLVGNDGGVIHCAVALKTPTVALFGPTDPAIWFPYERWGPYRVLHDDQLHPTGETKASRLMGITVEQVADTVTQLWSNSAEAGRA